MSGKRILAALLAVFMVLTLCACGKKAEEPAATPEPVPAVPNAYPPGGEPVPVVEATAEMTAPASADPAASAEATASQEPASAESASAKPSGEPAPAVMAEPTLEPAPVPTPAPTVVPPPAFEAAAVVPEATAEDLRPGVYTGSDGSVLTVNEDATATYETEVSGKINGKAMSAVLVFHGVYENGAFSFDKVTYGALDLTALAAAAGYTDAALWETAAGIIYGN